MTPIRSTFALAVMAFAAVAAPASAATDSQHDTHHPASTPAVRMVQAKPGMAASTMPGMQGMDAQMKAMQEMHGKMMAAKTPEERNALMADHMKAMQGGMAMMQGMSGMSGMGAASAPRGMPADMARRQQMLEQRMDMMTMMMEMMMDRLPPQPAAPAKK